MSPKIETDAVMANRKGWNNTVVADSDDLGLAGDDLKKEGAGGSPVKLKVVYQNVALFAVLHLFGLYGFYLALAHATWTTLAWGYLMYVCGGLGVTAGAHRLWAHRTYKAKAPLRFILMIFNCIALQNDIIEWSRDHRCHHKWADTDADPHNSYRGMFFSHIGWLLMKKHPEVTKKGKTLDLKDLYNDPILRFQQKYYKPLAIFFCFIMPAVIPYYFWQENFSTAFFVNMFRYAFTLNATWMVNSVAHKWGDRPYDKNINPAESLVTSLGALGEGWHNYHHTFPQDYKTSELPYAFNFSTFFIDTFAQIGWAYDRKVTSIESIQRQKARQIAEAAG